MTWDRFQYLEKLGVGGMGEVWKAYDKESGAIVALKKLHTHLGRPKDLKRFRREVKNLTHIRHKNIVRVVAVSPKELSPAYAMEYCPAGDLLEWLKKNPTESEKIDCFYQLCEGLAALHESEFKIVHRDLKPSNILLGADSNFKISDLGLSVSLLAEETRPTTSNWVSPGFSPPEQFNNMKSVLKTGDIYSLGAILRFMLTGKDCRESTDVDFDEIPKGMRQALQIMVEEDPNKRFRMVRLIPEFIKSCMDNPQVFIYDCKKCGGKGLGQDDPGDNYVGYACPECGDSGIED